ncbi:MULTISPECIES: hypothetical protein [unclassified Rhizobium]|uniref:hypothetical protein n=1 Tax=unclassified Rhizobium TaxID=2613769 RepID=UPI001AE9ACBE|nr:MULTISPECIES: hypothetical protein [unclassified Rhizobium]MBP2461835.1 hypothetical protein [Rhizobium sp. PvP014]MBP2529230.1 hypothetical protein [Rhizobium sp. PvP099]
MTTQRPFGAYIISYMPDGLRIRKERRDDLATVLDWWMTKTSIPITLITSNWKSADFLLLGLSIDVAKLNVVEQPSQPLILNRIASLQAFYSSEHDWGIMLDDDAVLYDGPQHNRGPRLFAEMVANGIAAYHGVDVFFPINPQKIGFSPIYATDPPLYAAHHVFERSVDLKGSMFVVRNFKKEGKPVVLPDPNFLLHGEDRHFALEAVSSGYSVMRCENIVLRELSGISHFGADRLTQMKVGYTRLARMYKGYGLKIKPESHQQDLKEFWKNCWGNRPTRIIV